MLARPRRAHPVCAGDDPRYYALAAPGCLVRPGTAARRMHLLHGMSAARSCSLGKGGRRQGAGRRVTEASNRVPRECWGEYCREGVLTRRCTRGYAVCEVGGGGSTEERWDGGPEGVREGLDCVASPDDRSRHLRGRGRAAQSQSPRRPFPSEMPSEMPIRLPPGHAVGSPLELGCARALDCALRASHY